VGQLDVPILPRPLASSPLRLPTRTWLPALASRPPINAVLAAVAIAIVIIVIAVAIGIIVISRDANGLMLERGGELDGGQGSDGGLAPIQLLEPEKVFAFFLERTCAC
jgi:hypothetical protein